MGECFDSPIHLGVLLLQCDAATNVCGGDFQLGITQLEGVEFKARTEATAKVLALRKECDEVRPWRKASKQDGLEGAIILLQMASVNNTVSVWSSYGNVVSRESLFATISTTFFGGNLPLRLGWFLLGGVMVEMIREISCV